MGMNLIARGCFTNPCAQAPNPNPSNWVLVDKFEYTNAYVLVVKYLDCTNFEGIKVMVYKGKYVERGILDPHFSEDENSPIARFRPDYAGLNLAQELAMRL